MNLLTAAAVLVPLPFILCVNIRDRGVVFKTFHSEYQEARAEAEEINEKGFEYTTGDAVSHVVNDIEVKEVLIWQWTGETPVCPAARGISKVLE